MYEDIIVTLLGLAIAFFLLIVLILLVYMWSRINVLEKKFKVENVLLNDVSFISLPVSFSTGGTQNETL